MSKLKSGQRVELVMGVEDGGDDHLLGSKGCIVSVEDDSYCEVRLDDHGQETFCFGCYQLKEIPD